MKVLITDCVITLRSVFDRSIGSSTLSFLYYELLLVLVVGIVSTAIPVIGLSLLLTPLVSAAKNTSLTTF